MLTSNTNGNHSNTLQILSDFLAHGKPIALLLGRKNETVHSPLTIIVFLYAELNWNVVLPYPHKVLQTVDV